MQIKDCEIGARLPKKIKAAVASAAGARCQTESEFVRQAVLDRLKSAGKLDDAVAA